MDINGHPENRTLGLVLNAEAHIGIKKGWLKTMAKRYKSVKDMCADMQDNIEFMKSMFDIIDKKFDPIQILIHKEDNMYIATFNNCGGGTQARSLNGLLDNCKEVLSLISQSNKDRKKKETKLTLQRVKNAKRDLR